jgi:tetratricopeptide (TPR) repeat protein
MEITEKSGKKLDLKEKTLSRQEIEAKLAVSGDFVKMDYLQACLKKLLDFDTKRFVMIKLASVYESRMMYLESGKLMRAVADINTTFDGKLNDFLKSMNLFVKANAFGEADVSYKKAIGMATPIQKNSIKLKLKEAYKARAKELMEKDRRKNALDIYERMASLELNPFEKKEVQEALLKLYEKLGKVKEYYNLQKGVTPIGSQPKHLKPVEETPPEKPSDFNIEDLFEE